MVLLVLLFKPGLQILAQYVFHKRFLGHLKGIIEHFRTAFHHDCRKEPSHFVYNVYKNNQTLVFVDSCFPDLFWSRVVNIYSGIVI